MNIILGIYLVLMALIVIMMVRNTMVFRFRVDLLGKVSDAAGLDIAEGRDWRWRYVEYDKVSYSEMVFKFWKPRKSFYKNSTLTQ